MDGRAGRIWATAAALLVVVVATGCDTGDGKQLQPYDPADYPDQSVATTLAPSTPTELDLDPDLDSDLDSDLTLEVFGLAAPWLVHLIYNAILATAALVAR